MDSKGIDADEETPSMRAVPMMTMANAPSMGGPSLFQSKVPSFGKPPPLGISRTPSGGLSSGSDSLFGVKQEWSASASPSVWDVKGEDLELVPLDFPLERTHREISEDASKVATRISGALHTLSIETEYNCEKAKAKCKTNDYVNFRIRLYAGSESGQPVIVEVQRRNGSASIFMRSCRAILDAAEGKDMIRKVLPFMKKPIGQMKCLQSIPLAVEAPKNPLDHAMEMLRSNKRDSNMLGLENLCHLTDPVITVATTAVQVSKSVIIGDEVREEIRALTERDVFPLDDEGLANHADQLRHLALTVFANALVVCSKDGCLAEALKKQKWFCDHLIPSLLDELGRAESFTNSAYQAACCVHSLVSCSEVAKQLVVDQGGVSILEQAHTFGSRRHALLASETRLCLETIKPARFESAAL